MRVAKESDWNTLPLPASHSVVALGHPYTSAEMEAIKIGVVPEEMEEKWFIYWKDERLYFHRSWTGNCIYIMEFESVPEGYIATRFFVNRDMEQYKETDDEVDKRVVLDLIEGFFLM